MALGQVRQGKEAIRSAGGNKGGGYTQFISWKKDEAKAVYFLTPIENVARVQMHNFVRKIVETDDGGERELWLTFMCRKDPAWLAESNGDCPLCDDIGHAAQERIVALAVEVEPQMDGKRLKGVDVKYRTGKNKEGEETQYPQIGLVMQASHNFFSYLLTQSERREIDQTSWDITREGEGLETKYQFYPIEYMPDLTGIEVPDLMDLLDNLGSYERYTKELAEGITSENQMKFGANKKKAKGASSRRTLNAEVLTDTPENGSLFDQMKENLEQIQKSKIETY